jgi:soluble lytic murein transglycosylase
MTTRSATSTTRPRPTAAPPKRRRSAAARRSRVIRRRVGFLLAVAVLGLVVALAIAPRADRAVQEAVLLPLRHDDIIRQQADEKDLDPALIAGVIFAESHFRDQTSHAGAKGLMQLMPETADYIAQKSGGTAFEQGDLATPQVNIAYGSWYLRHLLDKYDGSEVLALAAYNAGQGNVDQWLAKSGGTHLTPTDIPFPETRHYVAKVLDARKDYRREYKTELGL